jgi:preprotein translocase subunit SecE
MAFGIYKRGQGKYTRLSSAFAFAIVVALGCFQLYNWLQGADFGLDKKAALWVVTMVPAGLFVALSLLTFWLVNKPSIADFMVAAEGELKKVSWTSRREIAVLTFIVIMVVILLAILLYVTDLSFRVFFDWFI